MDFFVLTLHSDPGFQSLFAFHLHISASTVRKWEHGESRPYKSVHKLLNVIADKDLQAII